MRDIMHCFPHEHAIYSSCVRIGPTAIMSYTAFVVVQTTTMGTKCCSSQGQPANGVNILLYRTVDLLSGTCSIEHNHLITQAVH